MRSKGKHDRNEHAESEYCSERKPTRANEQHESREREQRCRPAEVDELLAAGMVDVAREEVPESRRVGGDLLQRPSRRLRRACDHRLLNEDAGRDRHSNRCTCRRSEATSRTTHRDVGDEERNHAEREVNLSRQRDRCERRSRQDHPAEAAAARALERPQRERQEHRDRTEQVTDALLRAVRR